MTEIVSGVPIPEAVTRSGSTPRKYPFHKMEIGDCLITDAGPTGSTSSSSVYYAARNYKTRTMFLPDGTPLPAEGHFDFVGRKLPDRPGKVGIWRVPCRCAVCGGSDENY